MSAHVSILSVPSVCPQESLSSAGTPHKRDSLTYSTWLEDSTSTTSNTSRCSSPGQLIAKICLHSREKYGCLEATIVRSKVHLIADLSFYSLLRKMAWSWLDHILELVYASMKLSEMRTHNTASLYMWLFSYLTNHFIFIYPQQDVWLCLKYLCEQS